MNYLMQINGILKPGPLNPQSPPPWQLCVCVWLSHCASCYWAALSISLIPRGMSGDTSTQSALMRKREMMHVSAECLP